MTSSDDGVLEADVSKATVDGKLPEDSTEGEDLLESERRLENDIAEADAEGPQSKQLRALQQAEQLGAAAERGLEAELESERARNATEEKEADPNLVDVNQDDPYEKVLEADIENHLCELRIQERQHGGAAAEPEQAAPPLPTFAPEPRK
mmetsp:Transcript_10133/g.22807  ORF Transcript_10133/g.22807 Transcript_10133/m.22807 type:complete len:150 (-) Transcript_10133:160-609(-)